MAESIDLDPDILRRVLMNDNASKSMKIIQQTAGLEQLSAELDKTEQQRDMFQARATLLATERDELRERLYEYKPVDVVTKDVAETETPKPEK